MKYIPSIAFEEMSGSAKGVTAAKVKSRKYIATAVTAAVSALRTRPRSRAFSSVSPLCGGA
jgi:hypothetical protein